MTLPSSSPSSSNKKRCSCGRPTCQAPQVHLKVLLAYERKAILQYEVAYLEKHLRFLDQVKADRENHLLHWRKQHDEYQAKMQQAWHVSSRPAAPMMVDLNALWRTELSDWYRRELRELTALLQEKRDDLEAIRERVRLLRTELSAQDVRPRCGARIAKVIRQHRDQLQQRQRSYQQRIAPLLAQRRELTGSYDATCQRLYQNRAIPPTLLQAKQAINFRWLAYVICGIGKPESRKGNHAHLDQEILTYQYRQECELHRAFFWYAHQYFQLGKTLIIEELPAVLEERIKVVQSLEQRFLPSHP